MYDEQTAYTIVHDMADIAQQSINTIIEMVLADGTYTEEVAQVLFKYIQERNAYLS